MPYICTELRWGVQDHKRPCWMRPVSLQPSIVLQWQKKMLFNQCVDVPVPWSSLRLPVCAGTWGSSLLAVLLSVWSYLQHFLQMPPTTHIGRIWWAAVLYWCTFSFLSFSPLLVSCGCTLWVSCPSSRGVPDYFVCPHTAAAPSLPWTFSNSTTHFLRCRGQNRQNS